MKYRFFKIIALLVFAFGIVFSSCNDNSTSDEPYKLDGDWTVLVYFCGSDLETNGASATENIAEMTDANFENKKVIFQTGGATKWHFDESEDKFWYKIENGEEKYLEESYNIPSDKIGRYRAGKDKIEIIEELDGQNEICKKSTITEFVKWGLKNYPSKHTALVFWNHGGGAIGGFGQDQNNENDNISIKEIGDALKDAGLEKKFDFIGFDTCLMGCYEVAVMASSYAEKLIASEEVESSCGWDWAKTINALEWSDYYKRIIDDFAKKSEEEGDNEYTLSCIDLSESKMNALTQKINYFVNKYPVTNTNTQNVTKLVAALEKANEFGVGGAKVAFHKEMFDIGNIFSAMGESISLPVLYKKNGKAHSNATGLSIYFPYCYRSKVTEYSEKVGDAFSAYDTYINSYVNYCTGLAVDPEKVFDNTVQMELNEENKIKFSIDPNFQAEGFKNIQVALFSVDDADEEKLSFFGLDITGYDLYTDGSVVMSVPKSWICFSDGESDNFVCAMVSNIADDNISYLIPAKMTYNSVEKEIILSGVYDEEGLLLNGFYNDDENPSEVAQRLMPVPENAQIKFLKPIAINDISNIDDTSFDITSSTEYYDNSISYSNNMLSFKRFSEGNFMGFVCATDITDEIYLNSESFVKYGIDGNDITITIVPTTSNSSE